MKLSTRYMPGQYIYITPLGPGGQWEKALIVRVGRALLYARLEDGSSLVVRPDRARTNKPMEAM